MSSQTQISFERPPVIETVLGVQFNRLSKLTHNQLGAFWRSLEDGWTQLELLPELDDQYETFEEPRAWGRPTFRIPQRPRLRFQIKNEAGDRMIQIQNGRLHYNWLGHKGQEYPTYSKVRPEFDDMYAKFSAYVKQQQLGDIQANQWEVTYVNHIPKGIDWDSPSDWGHLLKPLVGTPSNSQDIRFEGIRGHWRFEITPQRGRLHIELQHGNVGTPEGEEVLVFKLTARGPVTLEGSDGLNLDQGLKKGHDVIVETFYEMTSVEAHAYWREIP